MSKRVVAIGIMPQEKIRARVLAIAKGKYKPKQGEPKIWFTSMRSLAEVLSDENRTLLRVIRESKPASLAVGRHARLLRLGIAEQQVQRYEANDYRATVAVRGEADLLTVPALAGVLNSLVDCGCRDLAVDLAECRFMGASGLAVLVGVGVRLNEADGTVVIRSASALIRRILDITHVSDFVEYEASDRTSSSLGPEEQVDGDLDDGDSRVAVAPMASSTALVRSRTDVTDAALRLVTALADATVENADGVSVPLE